MKKWKYKPKSALVWWNNLSINQKVDFKKRFEAYRVSITTKKGCKYPDMYDLKHIRISKLADKHIVRIWVFRDRI